MKSRLGLNLCLAFVCLSSSFAADPTPAAEDQSWPPALPGAKEGTVTLTTDKFLQIPASCAAKMKEPGAAPFTVAKTAPTVDFAYHGSLPNQALNGTGWSAWGDIAVASTGMVYCGIGDHGEDNKGKSHAYLYAWNPKTNTLKQIIDVNAIVTRTKGEPTWSKVHAGILEGPDGNIYFSATLNDGNSANQPVNKWSDAIPGGQLYQYNPRSGKSKVFANLPAGHCTATTRLDTARYVWWCNLESSTLGDKIQAVNELYAVNLKTGKPLYRAPDGSVTQNRNFALARNGTVYFNGEGGIWKCDAQAKKIEPTGCTMGKDAGMRCSTMETKDGWIYGTTYQGMMFRYSPSANILEPLGLNFLKGEYTASCVLSPDQRFVYFLPGSHGQAYKYGTPVVQYEIATGQHKVLAFLADVCEAQIHYVPSGSFGVKISADGSTVYVNMNGHAADAIRPKKMLANGFGLTGFFAIHIPASER